MGIYNLCRFSEIHAFVKQDIGRTEGKGQNQRREGLLHVVVVRLAGCRRRR